MKTIRKSLIIGMTILGLAGSTFAVQAQDAKAGATATATAAHAHGKHAKHADWKAKRAERRAHRVQKLHDALKLAPAQEAAWATYTSAIKPPVRAERGERGAWKTMTAPERMEKRLAMAKQRVEMMEARMAATSTFYATLTPEQKKLFDENSMKRGGHRHHMKRGMAS